MSVKVIVLGARGMLGGEMVGLLLKSPGVGSVIGWDIDEVDIVKAKSVEGRFEGLSSDLSPDFVINCAAYTSVDGAEDEKELSFDINAIGAGNVASAAKKIGAKTIYISTDYVFDGKKTTLLREDDPPDPVNYYGYTKLMGEELTRERDPDSLIVRTQWLFGPRGKNFVETMLRLGDKGEAIRVVNDQHGSPTYTLDLARTILVLMEKDLSGTYHVSNRGVTTWFEFARTIFAKASIDIEVTPISTEDYKTRAKRPKNSAFDMKKLDIDAGIGMRHWKEGLADYLSLREKQNQSI